MSGLVEYVESVMWSMKFWVIMFCNKLYWMFVYVLLELMKVVVLFIVDFWIVIVSDEATKEFIEKEMVGVGYKIDVYVDDDLCK